MRGKDYNAGLRGVLFEAQHYERMGAAVWLYGWLVLRQTRQEGNLGLVLGGKPVSYGEIREETGFRRKTLERWMSTLRREGYIETRSAPGGIVIRITKAKKFPQAAAGKGGEIPPHSAARFSGGVFRRNGDIPPQSCGAGEAFLLSSTSHTGQISSGDIEKKNREEPTSSQILKNFCKPSTKESPATEKFQRTEQPGLLRVQSTEKSADARKSACFPHGSVDRAGGIFPSQEWRVARDAAVRRELRVGGGPDRGDS